jgi:hypothetical protein
MSNRLGLRRGVHTHRLQIAFHIARSLPQPVFVFDHRNADIPFAIFAILSVCNLWGTVRKIKVIN